MLKNFWYACEFSSGITNKPKRITMLNQNFVLYRDSTGQLIALKDLCAHRGAALSLGRVEEDCIRCPYHGWKYHSDGTCIEIPSNQPGMPIPKRAHVETYPVQEKYGLVWLFWGDLPEKERPPLPPFPEFGDSAWRSISYELRWNAHYTRVVENSLDPAHAAFVHAHSFGSGMAQKPQLSDYKVHLEAWGASASLNLKQHAPKGIFWRYIHSKDRLEVKTTRTLYMPNIIITRTGADAPGLIMFFVHVPVDDNTTISKCIQLRRFLTQPWADGIFQKHNLKIYREDKPVVESQRPKVGSHDLAAELYVSSDALLIAYRKLRQKCLNMGWEIDTKIVNSDYGNSYVYN